MKTDKKYTEILKYGCVPDRPVEITEIFTLFLRCCREPFVFAGELHEQWELVYVRRGEASITADDKVYHLSPGSLIFHRPMEFHQIHAKDAGLEIFVVSFRMDGEGASKLERSVFELEEGEKEILEEVIHRCVVLNGGAFGDHDFRDCRPAWRASALEFFVCVNALEGLFGRLLMRAPKQQRANETADSLLYRRIVAVLEEHIYTDITIGQVADRCGVSASTVKACFHRHAGCGVHKYLLKIKLRSAVRLLREGHSVSQVSDRLGFNNPNYFSYVFRRETGKRPTDFRK